MNDINNKRETLAAILYKQIGKEKLTADEATLLAEWQAESTFNWQVGEELVDDEKLRQAIKEVYHFNKEDLWQKLILRRGLIPNTHRIHFLKTTWFRYAAAIIIMVTGAAIWYAQHIHSKSFNPLNPSSRQIATIAPSHDRAILTLANGQQIILDSTQRDILKKGNLTVVNLAGKLKYEGIGTATEYNAISTPKGGQYQIVLPDGSKVWLNAASSIRFPTAFTANQRLVEITGESYLEIATNKTQPFLVKANGTTIQVLGTSFNVNAYEDEPAVKTTLLEGSVKIDHTVLKPGEAYCNGKTTKANIIQDMAWKNGVFDFDKITLKAAMRQLCRWYDVEAEYPLALADKRFGGKMERELSLSQALKLLNGVDMHFRLEGRKIIVTP